jgi:hypothetical protein
MPRFPMVERYDRTMGTEVQKPPRARPPILRKAAGWLVLVAAAALAIHFVVGLVTAVFYFALVVAVVVAIAWALKTIVW